MEKPFWIWAVFFAVILTLLILDLGIFHKKNRPIGIRESLWMSGFYILIALLFGAWIAYKLGLQSGIEYWTGFLVEKSLSLDNIFIIALIFSSFSIPPQYQHRILFFGVLGVIVFRAILITLGVQLVTQLSWVLYLFGLFMIFTGIKIFFKPSQKVDIESNYVLKWMRKHLNITPTIQGEKFWIWIKDEGTQRQKLYITPLLVALILIEFADLVFALDSIPAIFMITKDPYIVYTSNIFAILGLRTLYFALVAILDEFYYLKFSLAIILIFIGSKIFIADFLGLEKFPPMLSLAVTLGTLIWGCFYSLYKKKADKKKALN